MKSLRRELSASFYFILFYQKKECCVLDTTLNGVTVATQAPCALILLALLRANRLLNAPTAWQRILLGLLRATRLSNATTAG